MFRKILILSFCLIPLTAFAINEKTSKGVEYPTSHTFLNYNEKDRLMMECEESGRKDGHIICKFTQTKINHKNTSSMDDYIAKAKDVNDKMIQEEFDKTITLCQEFKKGLNNSHEDTKRFSEQYTKFCRNPSRPNFINLLNDLRDEEKLTCTIFNSTYTQEFEFDYQTRKWVHKSGPTGPCGMINIATLEKDSRKGWSDWSWDYMTNQVMTNKSGTILLSKCSELQEEETINYSAHSAKQPTVWLMDCKYIDLSSPF